VKPAVVAHHISSGSAIWFWEALINYLFRSPEVGLVLDLWASEGI
jgi:hypothetical protein